ncbi:hypothetical protein Tco_1082400 [Tanacetum coccineum]|uniref:Hybrid signal transduction histidine kinase M n=1 Tax=Tanacetum coccineum TaxID=301880 RepID=A0ABQ5I1S9_9ASTR
MTESDATSHALLSDNYEVSKYIHCFLVDASTSTPTPLTLEELKVDNIVLSWIFTTLSHDLQARSHTIELKAELRSLKLGDLSMDAYFRKIESIATILTSLGSPVSSKYVVTFSLEGLTEKYYHVCGIMHHRDTFPDLKTALSMLTTEEMRLNSKSQPLSMDSSSFSPMHVSIGDGCKFVHDENVKPSMNSGVEKKKDNTDELLVKILGRLGLDTPTRSNNTTAPKPSTVPSPTVYYTTPSPSCNNSSFRPTSILS